MITTTTEYVRGADPETWHAVTGKTTNFGRAALQCACGAKVDAAMPRSSSVPTNDTLCVACAKKT